MSNIQVTEEFLSSSDRIIDDFLLNKKCLYVQSPMGTGKTNIVRDILSRGKKVLMITNRVSLALEFKERYKEYEIDFYKDTISNKSLIVQYDSLHKIDINSYEIFILDELMSILQHSLSLLTNKALFNLTKLYLILQQKKIVVLDAFLAKIDLDDSLKLINNYREQTPLIFYKNKNYLIQKLFEISRDNRVSISCSSLVTAKAIFSALKGIKKAFLFSSETPEAYRDKILRDIKRNTTKFDVFIYTPAITTGIDIFGNFTHHFHLDEGNSCDIISSLQMLKRNRTAKEIHCFVENKLSFKETNYDRLNDKINKELANNEIRNPFLVEIDYSSGNYKLSKVGVFYNKLLTLKNSLENNRRKTFLELLEYQFGDIYIETKKVSKNVLEIALKDIKQLYQERINSSVSKEVNDINIANKDDSMFQRRLELERHIKDLFNKEVSPETLRYFMNNPKELKKAHNRELFLLPLKDIKSYKAKKINSFDFDTENIDLIIAYKKKNFILKELFIKSKLTKEETKFLKLIGYREKRGKLIFT